MTKSSNGPTTISIEELEAALAVPLRPRDAADADGNEGNTMSEEAQLAITRARRSDLFSDLFMFSDATLVRLTFEKANVTEFELHLADRLERAIEALREGSR